MDDASIVFLTGTDKADLVESLVVGGASIKAIVLPHKSAREERFAPVFELANRRRLPVLRPRRAELASVLRAIGAEILISAGYPYLLSQEDLSVARYNINVHPTLLPKYRGSATTWYIIANGDHEGGVTVHLIDTGMDTGNILAQGRFPLGPFDTLKSYMRKAGSLEPMLVKHALERLERGDCAGSVQNEAEATTYRRNRVPADSEIEPRRSLLDLYDFIRACDPERFPAFFLVNGQRVGIKLFRLEKPIDEDDLI